MFVCIQGKVFAHSGPIWLDDMECSSADRFQDCTHRGWGVHNCDASENIGLYCNPGNLSMEANIAPLVSLCLGKYREACP